LHTLTEGVVRRGGVIEQPRNLLKQVAPNFVEMPDAGVQNWCCGGGGAASTLFAIGSPSHWSHASRRLHSVLFNNILTIMY
jgi:Fe-S oxidoreductase